MSQKGFSKDYIFTEEEFNLLDRLITRCKLNESGFIIMQDNFGDYFVDTEEGKRYTVAEGIRFFIEAIDDMYVDEKDRPLFHELIERVQGVKPNGT